MAVTRKKIKEKFIESKKAPLIKEELQYISEAEEYIDIELEKNFDNNQGTHIDLKIVDFSYSPIKKKPIDDVKSYRKVLMTRELKRRYKTAGWKITYHLDDGYMSGCDYMILS